MKRTWTIIGVSDVPGSFKWYQSLFGQPETRPGHDYFGQILDIHCYFTGPFFILAAITSLGYGTGLLPFGRPVGNGLVT